MQFIRSKRRGHVGGAWFTTHKPEQTSLLINPGVSDAGEAVIVLAAFAVYACVVNAYRYVARTQHASENWETYRGMVYCQIHNDDVRFFRTVRGTSRTILKPPAFARPLSTLTNFGTFKSAVPNVSFEFSDGSQVELYSNASTEELTAFRKAVNLSLERQRKSTRR